MRRCYLVISIPKIICFTNFPSSCPLFVTKSSLRNLKERGRIFMYPCELDLGRTVMVAQNSVRQCYGVISIRKIICFTNFPSSCPFLVINHSCSLSPKISTSSNGKQVFPCFVQILFPPDFQHKKLKISRSVSIFLKGFRPLE